MGNAIDRKAIGREQAKEQIDSLTDEWLMQSYVEGRQASFATLVARYERELYSYLKRLVIDPTIAEDVFQTTFLQVHVKRRLYETGRPFRPWLYTIATNQAIDAMRRNHRHQRPSLDTEHEGSGSDTSSSLLSMLADDSPEPHANAERNERKALVRAAVNRLSDHLRAVIVLSYYQGMKYKEIADILGIPVGTVKSRLHAAIRKLADDWRQFGFAEYT